jgi:hypothetical protein
MSVDQLRELWRAYRREIDRFYEIARPALAVGGVLDDDLVPRADEALNEAAEYSQTLREVGEDALERADGDQREVSPEGRLGDGYDRAALLLTAAAAIDLAVAHDVLAVDPEPPDEAAPPMAGDLPPAPWSWPGRTMPEGRVESIEELLTEADALLDGMGLLAGAQPVPPHLLRAECEQDLDELVSAATAPALGFGFNMIAEGAGMLANIAVAETMSGLDRTIERVGRLKRHAVKLLREGFAKLLGIANEPSMEWALDRLRNAVTGGAELLLGGLAGRSAASLRIEQAIGLPGAALDTARVAGATGQLDELSAAYRQQMRWTARVATWLGRISPAIAVLAAHVGGVAIVFALDAVGLGFVLYTLTVRLDDRRLAAVGLPTRVEGVVSIVERWTDPKGPARPVVV